jgi:hypothetical protein
MREERIFKKRRRENRKIKYVKYFIIFLKGGKIVFL